MGLEPPPQVSKAPMLCPPPNPPLPLTAQVLQHPPQRRSHRAVPAANDASFSPKRLRVVGRRRKAALLPPQLLWLKTHQSEATAAVLVLPLQSLRQQQQVPRSESEQW